MFGIFFPKLRNEIRCDYANIACLTMPLNRLYTTFTFSKHINVKEKLSSLLKNYEHFVGLTKVKDAQNKVIQAERQFLETQEVRRQKQQEILQVQNALKEIRSELDKTSKTEDRFLHLITQEHTVIKKEKILLEEYAVLEKNEREYFSLLSQAVQRSQKENHFQAEKTKYWSLIGSVCGAVIGILGSSIRNWLHMREMKKLLEEASNPSFVHSEISQLMQTVQVQNCQMTGLVSDLQNMVGVVKEENGDPSQTCKIANEVETPFETLELQTNELLSKVKQQNYKLSQEMNDIKQIIKAHKLQNGESLVIYDRQDLERVIRNAEDEVEKKMKANSLITAVSLYVILVITVTCLSHLLKGS